MTTAQLRATARGAGITITSLHAEEMIAARGPESAADHVLAIGALITLADAAYGVHITQLEASNRLDHEHGDFDSAARRLTTEIELREHRRQGRRLELAQNRLERTYYAREARQRQATFIVDSCRGSLGRQATILLAAAADAELEAPNADRYRTRIISAVGREVDRRYPRRDGVTVMVEGSRYADVIDKVESDERAVRDELLKQLPTLRARIDRLGSKRMTYDLEKVLCEIRGRLMKRAIQGWVPNPQRYERDVLALLSEQADKAS